MSKRNSTRQRLVDSARELFWARGYEATSVADILERAEVNSGSLYHFFGGKEDLLLAVVDRYREFLWPNVFSSAIEDTEDPIERVFGVLAQYREALASTDAPAAVRSETWLSRSAIRTRRRGPSWPRTSRIGDCGSGVASKRRVTASRRIPTSMPWLPWSSRRWRAV